MTKESRAADGREVLIFGMPRNTAALFVMFLVALDSWTTLVWLRSGWGYELNPFMIWLTELGGPSLFVFSKLIITGACMLWMVHRARFDHARMAACAAFAIYGGVVGMHIYNGVAFLPA